jgi:hypothetical protein
MPTEKFKALVHYVVASCDDPHRLGAVRLNKICWFADTLAYRLEGTSITGERYIKRARGPVARAMMPAIQELRDEGKIHVRDQAFAAHKMRLFTPLEDADKSVFSAVELDLIDTVMAEVCDKYTAESISAVTHDHIWEAANDGEEIPLYATLASNRGELTEHSMSWADAVIDRVKESRQKIAAG